MTASTLTLDLDARLERMLVETVDGALERADVFGPHYRLLWTELRRSLLGGKRFRSALVLRTHEALGGPAPQAAVAVACAFEMLHTAFLVHDDLIDGDRVRRGSPNLAETMRRDAVADGLDSVRAERWALASAVLAGDLALAQAHRLVAGVDVGHAARLALLDLLDETVVVTAGGELEDTAHGLGLTTASFEDAVRVAESKTAMYSFRAPLRAGAVLAGAGTGVVERLDVVGRHLGRAFQLVDDLLGVFGPEHVTGKSNVSDLREGKQTPLLLHARRSAVWRDLAPHVGRPDLDRTTADRLRVLLARSEAPGLVMDAVVGDLATVAELAGDDVLDAPLVGVVGTVSNQVAATLADVRDWVEEARCAAV